MTENTEQIIASLQAGEKPKGYQKVYLHLCESVKSKATEESNILESAFYSIVSAVAFKENSPALFGISTAHFYVYVHQDYVDVITGQFSLLFPKKKHYLDPKFTSLEALVTLLFINDYNVGNKCNFWSETKTFPVIGKGYLETNRQVIAKALYDLGLKIDRLSD